MKGMHNYLKNSYVLNVLYEIDLLMSSTGVDKEVITLKSKLEKNKKETAEVIEAAQNLNQ
jgi:hypothetical protein